MKKVIGIVLAAIFLTTGIATATDFSLSGSYYVRGTWRDNLGGKGNAATTASESALKYYSTAALATAAGYTTAVAGNWYSKPVAATAASDAEAYGNWDHELSVDATWQIDDATKVFARFEMRDETWGTNGNETAASIDDNIYVEQVIGFHTFAATGGTLSVGLMPGAAWGTVFDDNGTEGYAIKYLQPSAIGTLVFKYQKIAEGGSSSAADDGDTDVDLYVLALITKLGNTTYMPFLAYVDHEVNDGSKFIAKLALNGSSGDFAWEAEADYASFSDYGASGDADIYGIYGKLSYTAGAATFGFLGAWGSYDDDDNVGFSFGDDFEAGGAMIIGDDIEMVGLDLGAGWLVAATLDYAVNDKLSLGAYVGYWAADDDFSDDTDAVEVSASGSYKITANLTYSVGLGWAELDVDNMDYDDSFEAYHKLAFSF